MSLVLASQLFYRRYQPNKPTSLYYIVPLARRCARWAPVAVMGTYMKWRKYSHQAFQGTSGTHRTIDKVNCFATMEWGSLDEPIPTTLNVLK